MIYDKLCMYIHSASHPAHGPKELCGFNVALKLDSLKIELGFTEHGNDRIATIKVF